MRSVNLKMPKDILDEGSAKYMQKIIYHREPSEIIELIRFPRSKSCVDLKLKYIPKTDRLKRCSIYSGLENYNRIKQDQRTMTPSKFKRQLKKTGLEG